MGPAQFQQPYPCFIGTSTKHSLQIRGLAASWIRSLGTTSSRNKSISLCLSLASNKRRSVTSIPLRMFHLPKPVSLNSQTPSSNRYVPVSSFFILALFSLGGYSPNTIPLPPLHPRSARADLPTLPAPWIDMPVPVYRTYYLEKST
jgi:hypothetical protein